MASRFSRTQVTAKVTADLGLSVSKRRFMADRARMVDDIDRPFRFAERIARRSRRAKVLHLAVVQEDRRSLLHEVDGDEKSRFVIALDDRPFEPSETPCLDAYAITRLEARLGR